MDRMGIAGSVVVRFYDRGFTPSRVKILQYVAKWFGRTDRSHRPRGTWLLAATLGEEPARSVVSSVVPNIAIR